MGAGILPVAMHKGKLYFLFGKENKYADTPGWSDFGGGIDAGETPLSTAIREAQEELTGFLGGERQIREWIRRGKYTLKFGDYTMFICPMEYNESLPIYYNNNAQFLHNNLDASIIKKSKIFEKSEIRWVREDELHNLQPKCRSYFCDTIDLLESHLSAIRRFVMTSTTRRKTRKR